MEMTWLDWCGGGGGIATEIYWWWWSENNLSNRKRFPVFASPDINTRGVGRILETVMQTRDEVEGLHNCRVFSQPLSCLYQAMYINI